MVIFENTFAKNMFIFRVGNEKVDLFYAVMVWYMVYGISKYNMVRL